MVGGSGTCEFMDPIMLLVSCMSVFKAGRVLRIHGGGGVRASCLESMCK